MPSLFDLIRQRSDYRRMTGRGSWLDLVFLKVRNAFVSWGRR